MQEQDQKTFLHACDGLKMFIQGRLYYFSKTIPSHILRELYEHGPVVKTGSCCYSTGLPSAVISLFCKSSHCVYISHAVRSVV